MGRRLFVGNLSYQTDENELTELFSQFGAVENAQIMRDMATGRARGFAFVEMATDEEGGGRGHGPEQHAVWRAHHRRQRSASTRAAVGRSRWRRRRPRGPAGGGGGGGRREPRGHWVTGSRVHGPVRMNPRPVNLEP